MVPRIKLLSVFAVLFFTFAGASPVSAAYVVNFRGNVSFAYYQNTAGCFENEIYLFPIDERILEPPYYGLEWSYVDVYITYVNICTGEVLIDASELVQIPRSDLQIRSDLGSATLNSTVTVFNHATSENIDLTFDLAWTATSPRQTLHFNDMYNLPECRIVQRHHDTFRFAEVTGSITYDGADVSLGSPEQAELGSLRTGQVFIGCS